MNSRSNFVLGHHGKVLLGSAEVFSAGEVDPDMLQAEMEAYATLVFSITLIQLTAREGFKTSIGRESFKSYIRVFH
jgi:hypothetical protein